MRRSARRLVHCERGAVAIDWVAICAAILLVGITMVYGIFNSGVADTAGSINRLLTDAGSAVDPGPAPDQNTFGAAALSGGENGSSDGTGSATTRGHDDE